MNKDYANFLLAKSQKGYEAIASDFSHTRGWFWPELRFVYDLIPEGATLLDAGCGNGRFLTGLKDKHVAYTGIDFSASLIAVAKERYRARPQTEFIVGDALKLPFPDNHFDMAVSFAVLHHIPSRAYRVRFLHEIARVTKPDGMMIVTAWNVRHSKPRAIFWTVIQKILGHTKLDIGDTMIGFNDKKGVRFVHALSFYEIRSLAMRASLSNVLKRSGTQAEKRTFLWSSVRAKVSLFSRMERTSHQILFLSLRAQ